MRKKIMLPDLDDRIPVENVLVRMLQSELSIKDVRLSDHFTDLGGNSFHAIRLTARIFDAFAVNLPPNTLLRAKSLQEVVQRIEAKVLKMVGCLSYEAIDAIWDGAARKKIVIHKDPGFDLRHPEAPPEALAPGQLVLNGALSHRRTLIPKQKAGSPLVLTPGQFATWNQQQTDPGCPVLNHCFAWHLDGWVDVQALEMAFRMVVRRHEILRTSFHLNESGPVGRVLPGAIFNLETVSFPNCPEEVLQAYVSSWMRTQAHMPFTLSKPPLMRARLVKLARNRHVLFVAAHRMLFDPWSISALAQELSLNYRAAVEGRKNSLKALPIQFSDFAAWDQQNLNAPAVITQQEYWEQKLDPPPARLPLPYDREGHSPSPAPANATPLQLGPELVAELKALARRNGTSVFTVLMAIYTSWLRYYTGQDDIMVGTLAARRMRPGTESLIGPVNNLVAIRTRLSGHLHFRDILSKVITETLSAFENADADLSQLLKNCAGQGPFFQATFFYRNREQNLNLENVASLFQQVDNSYIESEICLDLRESGEAQIEGDLRFDAHLFNKEKMARMVEHLVSMIARAASHRDPDKDTGSYSRVS